MKVLLAIYFFIIATVQFGLLTGVYRHYLSQKLIRPSPYWVSSLATNVVALYTFGGGVIFVESTSRTTFNFTIANTLLYAAAVLQVLFCQSLNRSAQKNDKKLSLGLYRFICNTFRDSAPVRQL